MENKPPLKIWIDSKPTIKGNPKKWGVWDEENQAEFNTPYILESEHERIVGELKEKIKVRIDELNQADADFCKIRWDMSKTQLERNVARDFSNSATQARQELERLLKTF